MKAWKIQSRYRAGGIWRDVLGAIYFTEAETTQALPVIVQDYRQRRSNFQVVEIEFDEVCFSPEPWSWRPNGFAPKLVDSRGATICDFGDDEHYYPTEGSPPSLADQLRIVACVNAHTGISTAKLLRVKHGCDKQRL